MKVRNGFVSNSSSSSFIIGLAIVEDYAALEEHLGAGEVKSCVTTVGKIKENERWDVECRGDTVFIESFTYSTVSLDVTDLSDDTQVFVYNECEGDDSDFWNEDWGEYNYDIDIDDFSEDIQKAASAIGGGTNGLKKGDAAYGAGRNG